MTNFTCLSPIKIFTKSNTTNKGKNTDTKKKKNKKHISFI